MLNSFWGSVHWEKKKKKEVINNRIFHQHHPPIFSMGQIPSNTEAQSERA